MPLSRQDKTNFTGGEISPDLLGRGDLRAFDNGARTLTNVFIDPTGGLTRRAGLAYIDTLRGPGRLVAFEFNTEQTYLLVFTEGWIDVYEDDARITSVAAPWSATQIGQITWTQSADTLLICHPDLPPRKLTRTGPTSWTMTPWAFLSEGNLLRQPYYRFGDTTVTLTPSATTGQITVTASAAVFVQGHNGLRLRIGGKQILVTAVTSPTQITATCQETLAATTATVVWDEPSFSVVRGWPVSACFHQHRLVIGGSRDLPNRLWLSQSADLWNFDLGTGQDDEAIEFGIMSDQVNAIRAVFSGRHLQVFTSGAEWMVDGVPLTPINIQLYRQTRIGSPVERTVRPRDVDGATLFVSRNGRELREFLFTYTEQAYQANDLALFARHLIRTPCDQDYDARRRLLFVVMADGGMAVLTAYRAESVSAWTRIATDGAVRSVAVVGDEVYLMVARGSHWTIERFEDGLYLDAALSGSAATPTASWEGLDHLEGRTVAVVADGIVRADATVNAGKIHLDGPASRVAAGLPYSHVVEPLPPNLIGLGLVVGTPVRLVEASFRLQDTAAVRIDLGRGAFDLPMHRFGPAPLSTAPLPLVSGDRSLKTLGWLRDLTQPLWRIAQDAPLPFTLLSVATELKVSE
ncbi:MAG: hypothetical protein WCO00_16425 [Rhodospirillaceae bacterium]